MAMQSEKQSSASIETVSSVDLRLPAFKYAGRLEGPSIRLLHLSNTKSARLSCYLTEVSLNSGVQYSALSYVWGQAEGEVPIICDQSILLVTQNLYDALHELRDRDEEGPFWIDAICINQADITEKTAQVRMMRDIFKTASTVIVWFGTATNTTDQAIDLLRKIHDTVDVPVHSEAALNTNLNLEQYHLPGLENECWSSLFSLLGNRWFTRVWIIQELIVATNSVILYGNYTIPTNALLYVVALLRHYANLAYAVDTTEDTRVHVAISNANVLSYMRESELSLQALLTMTQSFEATDKRDKVFALVGIASDQPDHVIDYDKDLTGLCISLTRYVMTNPKLGNLTGLDMLGSVHHLNHQSDLPSWCIDWVDSTMQMQPVKSLALLYGSGGYVHKDQQQFEFQGHRGLAVRSKIFDKVDTTVASPVSLSLDMAAANQQSQLDGLRELIAWDSKCRSVASNLTLPEYCRALVVDRYNGQTPASDEVVQSYQVWLEFLHSRKDLIDFNHNNPPFGKAVVSAALPYCLGLGFLLLLGRQYGSLVGPVQTAITATAAHVAYRLLTNFLLSRRRANLRANMLRLLSASQPFAAALQAYAPGRIFARSHAGSVAWVPETSQQGDSICAFQGCRPPFVVRPSGGRFKLVGACYLHSLMEGQPHESTDANFQDLVFE